MSAAERAASMSPEELIAVIERGLNADERTARRADAMTVDMDEPLAVIEGDEFTFLAVNPSRVLTDVQAKRDLLAAAWEFLHEHESGPDAMARLALESLARPYLDQETP